MGADAPSGVGRRQLFEKVEQPALSPAVGPYGIARRSRAA
jgi:hypothetical protein